MPQPKLGRHAARYLPRLLPAIYLLIALPVALFHALAMPPFQAADEDNHFLRAVALSHGGLRAVRLSDATAGSAVEHAAAAAAHDLDGLKFHPDRHVTPGSLAVLRARAWKPAALEAADFANTALYPPWFYAPATLGVLIARATNLGVADGLLLGRLGTALAGVAVAALALALCGRGRAGLFAVLCLPMTLALLGTCSQDGPLIAITALAAALLSRADAASAAAAPLAAIASGALLGLVVAARPPYAPLLVLPMLAARGRTVLFARGLPGPMVAAAAALPPLLWLPLGAWPVRVGFRPGAGIAAADQLALLAGHPAGAARLLARTITAYGRDYWHEFLGVLGWLDTPLPHPAYAVAAGMLGVAVAAELGAPWTRPALERGAALLAVVAAAACVMLAQDLTWTPVGAPLIEGVQGRYALPIACFVPLALAAPDAPLRARAWPLLYALASASLWFVPIAIMRRYYG